MSDTAIRRLTTATVLLVATIAAVVSYQHLYHLAITHGETRLDATLLPLSIDGTVVTASLVMLRAARLGLGTPWLARCLLGAAVAMTVAANVAFGWQYAAWGVLMAGWPAAAFLGNTEATISFGRKTRSVRKTGAQNSPPGAESRHPGDAPVGVPLPSVREIRATYQCSQGTAQKIRKAMRTVISLPAGASVISRAPGPPAGVNGHNPK